MKMKCMIVDDEPLARRVLEKYIASLPSLTLVKQCSNAIEATAFLHEHPVDLMFLDIKMPELTGLEFLKTLAHPPIVIITTAFSEYALEGYEYSVVDYLLKPVSFERFLKAVNKVIDRTDIKDKAARQSDQETQDDFVFLRADKIDHKVSFSEIRYIEGCGNFVKVYTNDRMIMISGTMASIEENLPRDDFIRVHKSYVVAVKKIDQIEGNMIRIGTKVIPIGKYYKRGVEKILEKHHLRG